MKKYYLTGLALLGLAGVWLPLGAQSVTIGGGSSNSDGTSSDPIDGFFNSMHYQVVYTAAELTTAGLPAGATLTGIGWSVSQDYGGGILENYTVRIALTPATDCATHNTATLTQVVDPFSYDPTVQTTGNYDMITFNTGFVWDGTNSILVDICTGTDNAYVSPYGGVRTITSTDGSRFVRQDNGYDLCAVPTDATSGVTSYGSNGNKPEVRFNYTYTPPAIDMSATMLVSPSGISCFGPNQVVTLRIKNLGSSDIDFSVNPATINCSTTGPNATSFSPVVINTGTLVVGATQDVDITTTYDMSLSGTYTFNGSISVAGDGNALNDALLPTNIDVSRVNTFPHIEGFSATPNPPFYIVQESGAGNWAIQTTGSMANPSLTPVLDPGYAFFNSYSYSVGTTSLLVTPCYDMTALVTPAIDIWMSQDDIYSSSDDRIEIVVSTDGGMTWSAAVQTLYEYNAAYSTADWLKYTVNLATYAGNSSVRIGLRAISDYGNNMGIDRIKVYDMPLLDAQPVALVNPVTAGCHSSGESVDVTVTNNGLNAIDFTVNPMTINVDVTGASTQNFNVVINTGTLGSGASANFNVTTACDLTTAGTHNFSVTTSLTGDGDNTNDNYTAGVDVADINTFPSLENFDGAHLGWAIQQVNGSGNWTYQSGNMSNPTLAPLSPNVKVYFNSYSYSTNTRSRLISPCVNLSSLTVPTVEFYMSQDNVYSTSNDRVEVVISTDGGLTWSSPIYTAARYNADYSTPGWKKFEVCLSAYAGQTIQIGFDGVSAYGNNFAIEDVSVLENPLPVAGTTLPVASVVCPGGNTDVNISGQAGNIQWQSSADNITFTNIAGETNTTVNTGSLSSSTYFRAMITRGGCLLADSSTVSFVTISAPVLSASVTDVGCAGNDGAVDLTVSGGTPGYTYSWSNSAATEDISGLSTGTYTVTVTDANSCTNSATATVGIQPGVLNIANVSVTDVLCNGATTGGVDITTSGGTTPFTYSWSNSASTEDISGVIAGIYTVTITDDQGCTISTTATVTEPTALQLNITGTDALCNGSTDGSADLTVTGGVAAYTYDWSNSASTEDLSSIAAGTYDVIVTDNNGCTATSSVSISEPTAIVSGTVPADVTCNGLSDGSGDLTVSGGTAGYSYSWSNGPVTEDISGVSAGTYTVTITDANGCQQIDSVIISEPALLTAPVSSTPVLCFGGNTGEATVNPAGGVSGYLYSWSTGGTSATESGLAFGTYTVTVTDGNGCTVSSTVSISQPTLLVSSILSHTDALCNGSADGTATANAGFGTPGYSYSWTPSGGNTAVATGLAIGTYTVTVTDNNGCTASSTVIITEPTVITASATTQDEIGGNDGSIDLTTSGGSPGYTYSWSNGSNVEDISGLAGGTYTVTVTDDNGCTQSFTFTVNSQLGVEDNDGAGDISIYPNPSNGLVNISIQTAGIQDLKLEVMDINGKLLVIKNLQNTGNGMIVPMDLTDLANGTYIIRLSNNKTSEIKRIIISK